MTTLTCPSRDDLQAFSLGQVDDEKFSHVSEHLTSCADCESTIAELESAEDSVLAALRSPQTAPHADEPECQIAMQALYDGLSGPSAADSDDLGKPSSGGTLHEYELLGVIGEGSMGVVHRARHRRLGHVVALKVLPAHRRGHASSTQRFEREIAAVGKLHHPNIVKAYDAGESDGMHFLVMELIDGVNLHQLVKQQGPLRVADACEIVRQAALGLEHAHQHGLIHRDLKPSNVLLSRDGEVQVLDLGLALLQDEEQDREDLTGTGQVMGTLDYLSPEQASDSHRVDHRTDLYGLGCTLFKLLTGHAPFGGREYRAPAKKIMAHAEQDPPALGDLCEDVPEELEALVGLLLAKSPDRRPGSAAELAGRLLPFTADSDLSELGEQIVSPLPDEGPIADESEIAVVLRSLAEPSRESQAAECSARKSQATSHGIRRFTFRAGIAALLLTFLAAGIIITIRRGSGPATTVEVPEGSDVKIGKDGRADVTVGGNSRTTANGVRGEPLYSGRPLSYWVQQLKDRDPENRKKAVRAVIGFGSPATEPLLGLLKTGDVQSRRLAVGALVQFETDTATTLPAVVAALSDSDDLVRFGAVIWIGRCGSEAAETIPKLVELMKDPSVMVRRTVVEALETIGSRPDVSVPALIEALEDDDFFVREAAAQALGEFPGQAEQITRALARYVTQASPDQRVGDSAFRTLGRLGEVGESELIELSGHSSSSVQKGAAWGLSVSCSPRSIQRLLAMLKDEDTDTPDAVLNAFARLTCVDVPKGLATFRELDQPARTTMASLIAGFCRECQAARFVFTGRPFLPENEVFAELSKTLEGYRGSHVQAPGEFDPRKAVPVALGLLGTDEAKALLAEMLAWDDTPIARETAIETLRFLGEDIPEDNSVGRASTPTDGKPESLEAQVDKLIEEARNHLQTDPARSVPALRAELERIEQLADLDSARRLALTAKIESVIEAMQGLKERREQWRSAVEQAIAEARELAKTDREAAARRLGSVNASLEVIEEVMRRFRIKDIFEDHPFFQLALEYERLYDQIDPTGQVRRRLSAEKWAVEFRGELGDAMAEVRTGWTDNREDALERSILAVNQTFARCRSLTTDRMQDEEVRSEILREIDDAERQLADAVRWSFRNPVLLDSYDTAERFTTGPLAWIHSGRGFVLASQRRKGSGPLDLWRSGAPVKDGVLLGFRRFGSVPDASALIISANANDRSIRIAQPAGIDGDMLTVRFWDYDAERAGAKPQPFDVKWQLKPPIRPDRAGSVVIHARGRLHRRWGSEANAVQSLFLRLKDKLDPHRSQLLFVRSSDGGKTWPDPPRLVTDDLRWPGPPLQPVCFQPDCEDEYPLAADHVVCMGMDEDDKAVFFRTLDGGGHWTKEFVRLPDPETGRSVPAIPLVSPDPSRTLVYAIPTGDAADRTYRLCHAWTGDGARSFSDAATIASNLSLPDRQLFSIRASTSVGVTVVTCPVPGDRAEEHHMDLLLTIDGQRRVWRAIRLDERLGGRVGLTAPRALNYRVFLAAEVENSARTENRHQLIVQEVAPVALEFTESGNDALRN